MHAHGQRRNHYSKRTDNRSWWDAGARPNLLGEVVTDLGCWRASLSVEAYPFMMSFF